MISSLSQRPSPNQRAVGGASGVLKIIIIFFFSHLMLWFFFFNLDLFLLILFIHARAQKLKKTCHFITDCTVCLSAVIFGEDVAFGGVFRCTVGLRDKYGKMLHSHSIRPIQKPLLLSLLKKILSATCSFSLRYVSLPLGGSRGLLKNLASSSLARSYYCSPRGPEGSVCTYVSIVAR